MTDIEQVEPSREWDSSLYLEAKQDKAEYSDTEMMKCRIYNLNIG